MKNDNRLKLDALSETDLEPVLKLFQGEDPDSVARNAGMTKERLLGIRDDILARVAKERCDVPGAKSIKTGRNEPCPCGSGKKYKHCCMDRCETGQSEQQAAASGAPRASAAEQAKLIKRIEKAFDLLSVGRYAEARNQASLLVARYPNEDRIHDILATIHLYTGEYEAAVAICKQRLAVAEMEKAYFIEHGRYRDAEIDQPSLSYIYPPLTWLQKYWIAWKAGEYQTLYPPKENEVISGLVRELQTADDVNRFPAKHAQGLEMRRTTLKETLEKLKNTGPEVIPYLLPLVVKYSWAGVFVPEILSAYPTDLATRVLIDISMFGFAFLSGASLHYLEKRGEEVIPYIREALLRDREFDPIKTGIVSVLGNIRKPASYEMLLDLLKHESSHIVNWAGDAIGKHNNIEALPAMLAASKRIGGERMIEEAILRLKDLDSID